MDFSLRRLKEDCKCLQQNILPRIIDCTDYTDYSQVKELHNLLRSRAVTSSSLFVDWKPNRFFRRKFSSQIKRKPRHFTCLNLLFSEDWTLSVVKYVEFIVSIPSVSSYISDGWDRALVTRRDVTAWWGPGLSSPCSTHCSWWTTSTRTRGYMSTLSSASGKPSKKKNVKWTENFLFFFLPNFRFILYLLHLEVLLSAPDVQDETIEMYMLQLVQALKHQNYYDSALCRFLLKRALNNQRLGHKVTLHSVKSCGHNSECCFLFLELGIFVSIKTLWRFHQNLNVICVNTEIGKSP